MNTLLFKYTLILVGLVILNVLETRYFIALVSLRFKQRVDRQRAEILPLLTTCKSDICVAGGTGGGLE